MAARHCHSALKALFHQTESDVEICTHSDGSPHRLGSGVFGEVFKACLRDGTPVALKLFGSDGADEKVTAKGASQLQKLLQSYLAGFRVAQFHGALLYEGRVATVNELQWETDSRLRNSLTLNNISWGPRALQIARDVARGLDRLHSWGMVHLGLKSTNVLIDRDFRGKVADSAQQLLLRNGHARLLPVPTRLDWTAPEVAASPRNAARNAASNPAADIYSLGLILVEMSTGQPPVRGTHQRIAAQAPAVMRPLIAQCLHLDPSERPTASAVEKRLEELLASWAPDASAQEESVPLADGHTGQQSEGTAQSQGSAADETLRQHTYTCWQITWQMRLTPRTQRFQQ
ncbi:hypothetical protein WJX73_003591 [Symbiochloris irregularis]|uniref:Protein kinase domain-containing protein n=1 Tax=Symbiochloris irregularis TaxID=706552 RepID=A0AAW1P1F1_9CHLO